MIKNLVIGGGGPNGFMFFGALKYLYEKEFWNIKNIESIYCTSAGSLIGAILSLNYNLNDIEDYIIKRPWDKLQPIEPENIVNVWTEKGIVGENFFLNILKPLLSCVSLESEVTLKDFYLFNKIDLHIFTSKIKNGYFECIDLNHETYPDLSLYKAISMSSAFPIAFKPNELNNEYYIDGGLCNNFPLNSCINEKKCDEDEILAICYTSKGEEDNFLVNENLNVLKYSMKIIMNMKYMVSNEYNQNSIKNIIKTTSESSDFDNWKNTYYNESHRQELLDKGKKYGEDFLNNINIDEKVNEIN